MISDDVKEAMELIETYAQSPHVPPRDKQRAEAFLAQVYIRDQREREAREAEQGLAIDAEWLRSVGGEDGKANARWQRALIIFAVPEKRFGVCVEIAIDGFTSIMKECPHGRFDLVCQETVSRGHFRIICAALGIPLDAKTPKED